MKKIAVIALVLIICLSAVGVGYASWTDPVNVHGKVKTGTVELDRDPCFSGTWVYKNTCDGTMEKYGHPVKDVSLPDDAKAYVDGLDMGGATIDCPHPECGLLPVAFANAFAGVGDDVGMVFWNIFPTCFAFEADATWTYRGSIPAVVSLSCCWDGIQKLVDGGYAKAIVTYSKDGGCTWLPFVLDDGTAKHPTELYAGYKLHLVVSIQLPQDNTLQNMCACFNCTLTATQWAECTAVS